MREDAQSLISTKKLDKEMREKEIVQGGLNARKEDEDYRIEAVAAKFEREMQEEKM